MEVGTIVFFKGIKSRGDDWEKFITDSHFNLRTPKDIYGKIFAIQGSAFWIHIYDKKTNKLLDNCTWGFKEEDIEMR